MLGRDALEAPHEAGEQGVDGVDAVDGALRAVFGIEGPVRGHVQLAQRIRVDAASVRRDDGSRADLALQDLEGVPAGHHPASGDFQEDRPGVVDARHDADLLLRQSPHVQLAAPVPRGPR